MSALWAHQRQKHAHKRCLSGARLAEDSRRRARAEVEREVLYDVARAVLVAIRYVVEANAAGVGKSHGVAFGFARLLFEFHQSFCGCEHRHESRNELCQRARRRLYAVHKLQEGCHAAECERASLHAHGSPKKRQQIAAGEAEVEYEVGENRELGAVDDVVAQLRLRCFEPCNHRMRSLKRLHHHAVLHGLLHRLLHTTVRFTHTARELSHAAHIYLAHEHEYRNYHDQYQRQRAVHHVHAGEGSHEH